MRFFQSTPAEVEELIGNFANKGAPLCRLPVFVFKYVKDVISPALSELFNESVISGSFPDVLKLGRVRPIHKKGNVTKRENFRPITTLHIISKVFEKLMYARLISFFNRFNILSSNQFGFQTSRSTADALLVFLDSAFASIEARQQILAVFLDFSKAFDTVDHEILLRKLEHVGIRGQIYAWFASYLENRKQFVCIGDERSPNTDINVGVPQGSTLGPLLFLLYVNDIVNVSSVFKSVLFADDTTLYVSDRNLGDRETYLNIELKKIEKWIFSNKLSVNVSKTTYMIITNRAEASDLNLSMNNNFIQRVNMHRFLGVVIDEHLNFMHHVDALCGKLSRSLGVMRRISSILPTNVLRNVYHALFASHMSYAITAYGSANKSSLNRIGGLVESAAKLLSTDAAENPFVSASILPFNLTYQYFVSLKMYQIINEGGCDYMLNKILSFQVPDRPDTRGRRNNTLYRELFTNARSQRTFLFQAIGIWNSIPLPIRDSLNVKQFKSSTKALFLNMIKDCCHS